MYCRSFRNFLILITAVVLNSAVTFIFHMSLIALWLSKSPQLAPSMTVGDHGFIQLPMVTTYSFLWLGGCIVLIVVGLFTCLPVMNLLFFHLRLGKIFTTLTRSFEVSVKNGKSTYMVIMEHRSRTQKKSATVSLDYRG